MMFQLKEQKLWIDLKDTTLSEISQSQKTDTIRSQEYEVSKVVKFTENRSNMVVAGG